MIARNLEMALVTNTDLVWPKTGLDLVNNCPGGHVEFVGSVIGIVTIQSRNLFFRSRCPVSSSAYKWPWVLHDLNSHVARWQVHDCSRWSLAQPVRERLSIGPNCFDADDTPGARQWRL